MAAEEVAAAEAKGELSTVAVESKNRRDGAVQVTRFRTSSDKLPAMAPATAMATTLLLCPSLFSSASLGRRPTMALFNNRYDPK